MVRKKNAKNRNPRSPGRRHATPLKERRDAYVTNMQVGLADAGHGDYCGDVSVGMFKRTTGRDKGKYYPMYSIELVDGEVLKARSQTEMVKKVSALVNSVRAKQVLLNPPVAVAAEDEAEDDAGEDAAGGFDAEDAAGGDEDAEDAAGEDEDADDADDAGEDAAGGFDDAGEHAAGGFGAGGFDDDDSDDDMSDDSDDDAAAAAAAAKQQRALKKLQSWKRKPAVFDDYQIFDTVKVTDGHGTYDAMVVKVLEIQDAAARTSSSRRFEVSFKDGTVSTVWPRSMTLVSSANGANGGVINLVSDDESDDEEMADAEEGSSSGSSNAV